MSSTATAHSLDLATQVVQATETPAFVRYDGQVESLQQADLAVQVSGRVLAIDVAVGDPVRAGQVLLRVDARTAQQGAAASHAQVVAAQAELRVAQRELDRKRHLAQKNYISQSALEQAQAAFDAAQAQVRALQAQAGAAQAQNELHVLRAPFDGVVASTAVELGDMVMPGRPLITMYDPTALRVTAQVPARRTAQAMDAVQVWLPASDAPLTPTRLRVLPTVDARSLTQEVRADLSTGALAVPGQYARLQWPDAESASTPRILIPAQAVVRRGEVSSIYVLGADDQPQLRQVRLGPTQGDQVEVLSGLDAGETLVTNPQAATRAVAERRK